jgi:uncharacterized membrane protein YvbJ
MKCETCGYELAHDAQFCPSCGARVSTVTKAAGTAEEIGERTGELVAKGVEKAKPLGKGLVKVTGKALEKAGSAAKKTGKKLKEVGEE